MVFSFWTNIYERFIKTVGDEGTHGNGSGSYTGDHFYIGVIPGDQLTQRLANILPDRRNREYFSVIAINGR
jgi:hypothetical protein